MYERRKRALNKTRISDEETGRREVRSRRVTRLPRATSSFLDEQKSVEESFWEVTQDERSRLIQ